MSVYCTLSVTSYSYPLVQRDSHAVALGSVRQLVDYVLDANIRFVFVIARQ